jgi:hypothetical protein
LGDKNIARRFHQEEEPSLARRGDPDAANNAITNNNIPSLDFSIETWAMSNFVPAFTTGTNSTIMHMNLSTEAIVKWELERRQGRDKKKEEDIGQPVGGGAVKVKSSKQQPPTMASDDDWLDEMVCWIEVMESGVVCMYLFVSGSNLMDTYCSLFLLREGKPMPSPAMTTQKAAKKSKNKNKEAVEKERARQI